MIWVGYPSAIYRIKHDTAWPVWMAKTKMIKDIYHTEIHLTYLVTSVTKVQWAAAESELIMPFSIILIQKNLNGFLRIKSFAHFQIEYLK